MEATSAGRAAAWLLLAASGVANVAGYALDLYGRFWWFDRVLHAGTIFALTFWLALFVCGRALKGGNGCGARPEERTREGLKTDQQAEQQNARRDQTPDGRGQRTAAVVEPVRGQAVGARCVQDRDVFDPGHDHGGAVGAGTLDGGVRGPAETRELQAADQEQQAAGTVGRDRLRARQGDGHRGRDLRMARRVPA